ncbi:MAG TPA: protein kinase [Pyrinomonadaceae bacterium]|jgi:serine/threonine protein kinase
MLSGKKLGRYNIREKIGSGGMGEVYLATDEKLNRSVALKVLLPEFCCDAERVERFKLEARAASALNHPNIITIHEIDQFDDQLFIATEFVDGETLREKIEKREITFFDAIQIAEQTADALAVAHESHIIHRDIKPENIMIRRDGYVKILDFGLAKPIMNLAQAGASAEDATIQMIKTQPGLVMGSVRYMSPEQARGKDTDERTDVWSLGVVLYEMLSGENPFDGETVSDSLAALIHVEPMPLADVPEELQRILRKALKKKATERYQSIKDFALDLKDLRSELERDSAENRLSHLTKSINLNRQDTSENKTLIHRTLSADNETAAYWSKTRINTSSTRKRRSYLPLGLIALALILALTAWHVLPKIIGNGAPKFQSIQVDQLTNQGNSFLSSISPEGKLLAFVNVQDGKQSLVVRQIAAEGNIEIVPPTFQEIMAPTFTPDGSHIYYVTVDKGIGTLYQIPSLGKESKKLLIDVDSPVTFSPDGKRFAFFRHNPTEGGDTIFIANADGTNLGPFLQTKEAGYDKFTAVAWSSDGERILVGVMKLGSEQVQKMRLATVSVKDRKLELLGENAWYKASSFQWLKDNSGFIFAGRANSEGTTQIWFQPYPAGELKQITNDTSDYASVSASDDGNTMVATKYDTISSIWSLASGTKELKQVADESKTLLGFEGMAHTSDGKLLYSRKIGKEVNIFALNESDRSEKQLTKDGGNNFYPFASPDGKYIVFTSNRNGAYSLWRMDADGKNPFQLTNFPDGMDGDPQILSDNETVLFFRQKNDGSRATIMKASLNGGEAVPALPESQATNLAPRVSADGKQLAYVSFIYDSKTSDFASSIKIAAFDGNKIVETGKQVKREFPNNFQWSPDGKSITYVNKAGIDNIWNLSVGDGKESPLTDFKSGNIPFFLWSHDGKRLFIIRSIVNSDLILIKNKN